MFSNDKELNDKFRDLISAIEADTHCEFIENITELYRANHKNFQLVLFPTPPFEIDFKNDRLIDKANPYKSFETLITIGDPDLNHFALLNEDFIFFQCNKKQVILLSKVNDDSPRKIKDYNKLEDYFFNKIMHSRQK